MQVIEKVESLCPECLANITGTKFVDNSRVYIKKECPIHGDFTNLISENVDHYLEMEKCFEVTRSKAKTHLTNLDKGCPFDCGLCPSHKQDTCLAIIEVTDRCDMGCTYCFANSSLDKNCDPNIDTIRYMFETVKKCQNEPTCVQISGGEPTLREDLPDIIKLGKEIGINHIELNTNGKKLATDDDYFQKVVSSGIDAIYLSFDGISDDIYTKRSKKMKFNFKNELINKCEKAGIGVVLVPLVARNYNLHQVGKIIEYAAKRVPTIRGVHFQPVFYSGRSSSDMNNRITILELLQEIEKQTDGQIKVDNFTPSLMPHAHCGATCLTLIDNDSYLPLTNISLGAMKSVSDVASKTKKSIMGRWKGNEQNNEKTDSCGDLIIKGSCCDKKISNLTIKSSCCEKSIDDMFTKQSSLVSGWADFIEKSMNSYLTISTMAFQDVWSYEKGRVEHCCIHVVTQDGRFIPFCNYNMTSCDGKFLYRNN